MTQQISIRPAHKRDAAEIAILVDLSSHGFASWIWNKAVLEGEADTPLEYGAWALAQAGSEGWENTAIAEVDYETAGLSVGYTIEAGILDQEADHPVFAPLLQLQQQMIGHRFIDSVGVYKRFRGKGLGRLLVAHEIEQAEKQGNIAASLITESDNHAALSLYKSMNFKEVSRLAQVPHFEDCNKHDWVFLTRSVM
ncbi:GNAT family N-acetyltransferase [Paenochrobactrum sp. BZR 588]|uniref:GNAT family N-acetyltransferase n=1 Tax=Paenochrobactrum TaxID=999488 RepID=UPI0035BBEE65